MRQRPAVRVLLVGWPTVFLHQSFGRNKRKHLASYQGLKLPKSTWGPRAGIGQGNKKAVVLSTIRSVFVIN